MGATIFHVDLDAFYASVEQRDNATLRGKPVIVGAMPGQRGVVAACSYEARRFGVRSAMPISEAWRRCPQGVFVPARMDRYAEVSRSVMAILAEYTPHLQQISVDEAFLDLSGTERLLGDPLDVGRRMKDRVREAERLNVSVGIAPNRYLAKLACEAGKPDGLVRVAEGGEIAFLDGLALKDLWGVGKKTRARLREAGITTIPELRALSRPQLASMLGEGAARLLYGCVRGEDPGIHSETPRSHSLSHEITFEHDTVDREHLRTVLLELSQLLMERVLEGHEEARTLFLKLRTHDFKTTTIQTTLAGPPASTGEIHRVALELLDRRWDGRTPVRLIGVGLSGLAREGAGEPPEQGEAPEPPRAIDQGEPPGQGRPPKQGELFDEPPEQGRTSDRRRRIEEVALELKKKKDASLTRASLLGRGGRKGLRDTPGRGSGGAPGG